MPRIAKLFALSREEISLLVDAIAVVTIVSFSLVLFRTTRTVRWASEFAGVARKTSSANNAQMIRAVAVATQRAARLVPGATCLTQAISARILLQRRGQPSTLRLGVAKPIDGSLDAHAWLEVDDATVIGHFMRDVYVRLADNEAFH